MGKLRAEFLVCAPTDENEDEQQAFVFDTRPLAEQIETLCECFDLPYDHDEEYHVLTSGPSVETRPIRSEAEVLILPPSTQLGLHHGSDVAEARIRNVAEAAQGSVVAPLRELLFAIRGDLWLSAEVVEKGGITAILESVMNITYGDRSWMVAVELAMVCLSVLISLCQDEAREWLSEHFDELGVPFFVRLLAVVFPPRTDEDLFGSQEGSSVAFDTPPRACLTICLFLLQYFPSCAEAFAEAASIGATKWGVKAAGGFSPAYPRLFAAMRGEEDRNEFQMSASVAVLCALVGATTDSDELRPQVRNDFANFTSKEELEELFASESREHHLREMHMSLAVDCCSNLQVGETDELMKEVAQLKTRMQMQQHTIERLEVELQQRHRACVAMVPFMKVDSSLLVEQSLDSLVRFGWESISWRNNYTLLHFAADCLDDPRIIELVGAFTKDVDQRDDSGKRPIDYARQNTCPEVVPTLERLRKQHRRDKLGKLVACLPDPDPVDDGPVDREALKERLRELECIPPDLQEGINAVLGLGAQGVPWLSGFTALHLAAQLGHVDATDLLLQARADVDAVDDWDFTALDYAEENNHTEVIKVLEAAGATSDQQSPLAEDPAPLSRRRATVATCFGCQATVQKRHTMSSAKALDLTESRKSLCAGLLQGSHLTEDDEDKPESARRPNFRLSTARMSMSRVSMVSDSDFGLSDQQLADIGMAYSRSQGRHRALTSTSTISDASSVHSSHYGLSDWQMLQTQEGRQRCLTSMTDLSVSSAQDSEFGVSDRQVGEVRHRYANSIGNLGMLDEDPDVAGSESHPWGNTYSEDGPMRVQTSGLNAVALQQLRNAEPETHDLHGQGAMRRRLTESSEKRFSTVTDSDFGLSDQQLASLSGKQWDWKTQDFQEAKSLPSFSERNSLARPDNGTWFASASSDASPSNGRQGGILRDERPTLRKRVSFKADSDAMEEEAADAYPESGGRARLSSLAEFLDLGTGTPDPLADVLATPSTGSNLVQNLETELAAMFKDETSHGSNGDAGIDSAALFPGMEQNCRRACRLVMQKGWGNVNWENNFTALHLAAHHGEIEAVRFLMQARASLVRELQDSSGLTPMDYAREAGITGELLEILQAPPAARPTCSVSAFLSPQSVISECDAVTEKMIAPRTRDPAMSMDPVELHTRLMRAEKERAALLDERNRPLLQGGSALAHSGQLDESTMKKLLEQLQAFGRDSVLGKVQEQRMSGGLALSAADATGVVDQLEIVLRVCQTMHESSLGAPRVKPRRTTKRHSTWNGGENPLADILATIKDSEEKKEAAEKEEQQKARASWGVAAKEVATIASSFLNAAPDCGAQDSASDASGPEEAADATGPPQQVGEAEPAKAAVDALDAVLDAPTAPKGKGKGKPPKGPPVPGATGKGKGKAGNDIDKQGRALSKPKLEPEVNMKPLWWTRYLKGVHLKEGETVWDLVADETDILPVDLLHARFGKAATATKTTVGTKDSCQKAEEQQPTVLRIIKDPALIAGREAALKNLPSPQEVAAAIIELDEQVLQVDKLQNVMSNACPTPLQVEELTQVREKQPTVRLAVPEQYMWVIMHIPAYKARLDCWSFVRTYTERRLQCVEALRRFEEIADCFRCSGNLPSLLGLILAVGNYLNGGTERGQADGFDLETLAKLESVKDVEGRDLRHLIFETFFNKCPEKACKVVEELCPLLANVLRSVVRDTDGAEKLTKKVNVAIEDYDCEVSSLEVELEACLSSSEMILQYIDDPADHFKLRMPEQIAQAKDQIGALSQQRDRAKEKFGELMHWFKVSPSSGLKSSDFCLLWDELFIPEAMVIKRPAKIKREYLMPSFCGPGKRITGEQLMVLWGLREATTPKKSAPKAGMKGGRRERKRPSLGQKRPSFGQRRGTRMTMRTKVSSVIAAQRLDRSAARELSEEQLQVEEGTFIATDVESFIR